MCSHHFCQINKNDFCTFHQQSCFLSSQYITNVMACIYTYPHCWKIFRLPLGPANKGGFICIRNLRKFPELQGLILNLVLNWVTTYLYLFINADQIIIQIYISSIHMGNINISHFFTLERYTDTYLTRRNLIIPNKI